MVFPLSQDTVVALQALSTFAAGRSHDIDLVVTVETDNSTRGVSFNISQENYLLHQSQEVHQSQHFSTNCTLFSVFFLTFLLVFSQK